ncbi:nitrilase-related carbon-nitrogen hydrolase [Zongyangia hominis]|nr:nitrilase-related carbon-nitrogen hydrolase [Zongyangia hominis]
MILGLVQMVSRPGAVDENLRRMADFCREAAGSGVDLLCFPELSITGYHPDAAELAQPVPGPASGTLSRLAASYGMTVCAGLTEHNPQGRPFLSQLVCLPDGRVFCYRKTHLGHREAPLYAPGGALPVFSTPKAKVGLALCWEARFPEVASTLAHAGAEVLLYPHASPMAAARRRERWKVTLAARALDCGVYVGCCNAAGDSGRGFAFSGGAMAFDPDGQVMAEHFAPGDHLLTVPLLAAALGAQRSVSLYLDHRRPDLYR